MSPDEVFAGKVVQIFVEEPAIGGVFENVHVETLEGRDFLVGTLAPHSSRSDLRIGKPFWIAINAIQMFAIFQDLEEAQGYYNNYLTERKKSTKNPLRRWLQR